MVRVGLQLRRSQKKPKHYVLDGNFERLPFILRQLAAVRRCRMGDHMTGTDERFPCQILRQQKCPHRQIIHVRTQRGWRVGWRRRDLHQQPESSA